MRKNTLEYLEMRIDFHFVYSFVYFRWRCTLFENDVLKQVQIVKLNAYITRE